MVLLSQLLKQSLGPIMQSMKARYDYAELVKCKTSVITEVLYASNHTMLTSEL